LFEKAGITCCSHTACLLEGSRQIPGRKKERKTCSRIIIIYCSTLFHTSGILVRIFHSTSRGSVVVKSLRYKAEGRRFETRWELFFIFNLPNTSLPQ
jgi:hypothetical protein